MATTSITIANPSGKDMDTWHLVWSNHGKLTHDSRRMPRTANDDASTCHRHQVLSFEFLPNCSIPINTLVNIAFGGETTDSCHRKDTETEVDPVLSSIDLDASFVWEREADAMSCAVLDIDEGFNYTLDATTFMADFN
ncbi:Aste57867_19926 [Aphanomyces stellatus]|uniref:Aste57867_19926 protein n=1 Tax=Aphanomyces stellatus TaxID=120398 RepID=A0A485LF98_9STRA|nr:hypothetical protein As57867_019860 [Aphanomyces stellatus]VFT96624.1 Aste57867_19926 [Aphanomyces stellatus]